MTPSPSEWETNAEPIVSETMQQTPEQKDQEEEDDSRAESESRGGHHRRSRRLSAPMPSEVSVRFVPGNHDDAMDLSVDSSATLDNESVATTSSKRKLERAPSTSQLMCLKKKPVYKAARLLIGSFEDRSTHGGGSVVTSGGSVASARSGGSQSDASSIVESLLQTIALKRTTPAEPAETQVLAISEMRLAGLIRVLSSPDRKHGIPKSLVNGNELARRMRDVYMYPMENCPSWLLRPLFEGLIHGGQAINASIAPPTGAQEMPILIWLCQWKSLQKLFGWKGENDLISLALAAGADPNVKMKTGSTPIFFAVKYGSLETVRLLVKNGANIGEKDNKNRTCLWNALEHPNPGVISYLLKKLPAGEKFPYHPQGRKKTSFQSAVDYLFAAQLSLSFDPENSPEYPWSWQVLGKPTVENIAYTLIEFGRQGVSFTPNDITIALLSFVLRGDDPNKKRIRYPNYAEARITLEMLARLLVGLWLPYSVHQQITCGQDDIEDVWMGDESASYLDMSASIGDETSTVPQCSICQQYLSEASPDCMRMYCGHTLCGSCLIQERGNDKTCPVCHRQLPLELCGSHDREACLSEMYGVFMGPHGPDALSPAQLRTECQARGRITLMRSDESIRARFKSALREVGCSSHGMELNSNVPITNGIDVNLLSPKRGPVVIPVKVKSIPILAYVSTTSSYTLLSPDFVKLFGLTRTELRSSRCTNLLGDCSADGEFSAVQDLELEVGGIKVPLHDAMEAPLKSCMGVQLGLDFLRSGAWCVMEARVDGNVENLVDPMATLDGFGHINFARSAAKRKEEMRYYTHDGKTVRMPLLHLQPFKEGGVCNWISVSKDGNDIPYQECNWCCRTFPEGMIEDKNDEDDDGHQTQQRYYCSEVCRQRGVKARVALASVKSETE